MSIPVSQMPYVYMRVDPGSRVILELVGYEDPFEELLGRGYDRATDEQRTALDERGTAVLNDDGSVTVTPPDPPSLLPTQAEIQAAALAQAKADIEASPDLP